jgi:hypothetical protein
MMIYLCGLLGALCCFAVYAHLLGDIGTSGIGCYCAMLEDN